MVAVALGAQGGVKHELDGKREQIFSSNVLSPQDDLPVLRAVALAESGDVSVLDDLPRLFGIAEEFANAGIEKLKALEHESTDQQLVAIASMFLRDELGPASSNGIPDEDPRPQGPDSSTLVDVMDLLRHGESDNVEFKETFRWDIREARPNKSLQRAIAKTVAGFLNTDGGNLLIGISDDGRVEGIGRDLESFRDPSQDQFQLAFSEEMKNRLGGGYLPLIKMAFVDVDEKVIAWVRVNRSPKPVYLIDGQSEEFFIRAQNSTKPLGMRATQDYISMHFRDAS